MEKEVSKAMQATFIKQLRTLYVVIELDVVLNSLSASDEVPFNGKT